MTPAVSQATASAARSLSYALVTPARNEADNLRRLADCIGRQRVAPVKWVIVENGSTDDTLAVAEELAHEHDWICVVDVPERGGPARGGAIVRAFAAGLGALEQLPEILVNLDADVSFGPDYFERLLARFDADPALGIASGSGWELERDAWRQRFVTRSSVWGATRAYRRACLEAVLPLEERYGWDGIDELQARVRGWRTETLLDLPFLHHRRVGERDGAVPAMWAEEGRLAHFMGYRFDYLLVRALFRVTKERSTAPLGMVVSFAAAAARREPRWRDAQARRYLRDQQRLRRLPLRALEALGRRA